MVMVMVMGVVMQVGHINSLIVVEPLSKMALR